MKTPPGDTPSPFAARTRSPFNAQPSESTTAPVSPRASKPAAMAPVSAPATATAPASPPAPKAATTEPGKKKSGASLVIGLALGVLGAAAVGWFLFGRGGDEPAPASIATSPVSPASGPKAVAPAAPARDAKADYAALALRAATLDLEAAERAAVAEATLRAEAGAHAEAQALLGPLVARRVDAAYAERAAVLRGVKLDEHPTASVNRLREVLGRADAATESGLWAEAVARRDEALALAPTAQAEIAARIAGLARAAADRGDPDLATYFYERVLRLESGHEAARAHLFAHKFKPGQIVRATMGLEFAYVPPGTFVRGSRAAEPGRSADETSATVRLTEGFFLGVTEVTQRQWDQVFGAGSAASVLAAARAGAETIGPDLPMHSVRWEQAREFCEKLSALEGARHRLPTEAEWEYACRAGTTSAFNLGGDGLSARDANIDDGSAASRYALASAGSTGRANAWGLRDMHGNVWEWCADWSAPYPEGEQTDPRGPADDAAGRADLAMKTVRGGGWNAPAGDARSANRWEYSPAVATSYIGLRVAREPALIEP